MFEIPGLKRTASIGIIAGSSVAFSPTPASANWEDAALPDFRKSSLVVASPPEIQLAQLDVEKRSPVAEAASKPTLPAHTATAVKDEASWKAIALAALSCLITVPGYALALRRGTPHEKREQNPIYRLMDSISPDKIFFPNNRATYIASTANSSALFGLGMLQSLSQGQSFGTALASLAVIGIYGLGSAALASNAVRHGRGFEMSTGDKVCLSGSLLGVTALVWSGLTRAGVFPPVHMPLEMFGIVTALAVRTLALTPLVREFFACARAPHPEKLERGFPNLVPHIFWTTPVLLNLLNPQILATKAGIVPVVVSVQGAILLGIGTWARNKYLTHSKNA